MKNRVLMGKFGAFVECHFGKQLMLHHLLLLQHFLLCIVFISKARFFSLLIERLINLLVQFLLWPSLFFQQGEGFVLILPTSSTFHVWSVSHHFFFVMIFVFCIIFCLNFYYISQSEVPFCVMFKFNCLWMDCKCLSFMVTKVPIYKFIFLFFSLELLLCPFWVSFGINEYV